MKELSSKQKKLFIIGLMTLLVFVVGATYAYFQVSTTNNVSSSSVTGTAKNFGTVSLTTNTSKLYLNFNNNEMSTDYAGTTYYANSNSSGTPLTTNPNYTLATASLTDGEFALDCDYSFTVTASVNTAITDGSDSDVKITIGNTTLTLKELTASSNGVTVNGNIKNLVTGTNQTIGVSSSVTNSNANQNSLMGNSYTISIAKPSISCDLHEASSLADTLIASGNLWQSGLEGDGYRFTGSGNATASTSPKNFICFGTTDKNTCTANPSTYMYRIIGVFADENGDNHVKLIKYTQLPTAYVWNSSNTDVDWANSTLYAGLNGSYFLTNTTYSYMQDNTWLNKITDWKWSAVNTKTYEDKTNNPDYYESSPTGIYLSEMNKGSSSNTLCTNYNGAAINCLGGSWTTPTAKIGLMYASDYALSLGQTALSMTTGTYTNRATLKTGWMHLLNNDTTASEYEWTISRYGLNSSTWIAWCVDADGGVFDNYVVSEFGSRAVFYLESDIEGEGVGSITDPIILR